jgi:hypothetical protein
VKRLIAVAASLTTLLFMSCLFLGLLMLFSGKLELARGTSSALNRHCDALWAAGKLPLFGQPSPSFAVALCFFAVGAVGLLIPLVLTRVLLMDAVYQNGFLDRRTLDQFLSHVPTSKFAALLEDLRMNERLTILQAFLAFSAVMGFVVFHYFSVKLAVRIGSAFGVVALLRFLTLVPRDCRLWSGYDPRKWLRVLSNGYANPIDCAAMAAMIGIDMLGLGYALITMPHISDPLFTFGSFNLFLFSYRGFLATRQWMLMAWTVLNLIYTAFGVVHCALTVGLF